AAGVSRRCNRPWRSRIERRRNGMRSGTTGGRRGGERGIALVLILLIVAVLSLLGLTTTRSSQTDLDLSDQEEAAKQALGLAESGISHAYSLLRDNSATSPSGPSVCTWCWGFDSALANGGTGGALTGIGNVTQIDGGSYR